MNVSVTSLLVGGVLLGAASSLLTVALLPDHGSPDASDVGVASASQVQTLRRQVQSLTDAQAATERALSALQLALVTAGDRVASQELSREPLPASQNELAELAEQVASLTEQLDGESQGPFMIENVSEALATIREQEDRQRQEQRDAFRDARREERLAALAKELGLDAYQQGRMEDLVTDLETQRETILDQARASGDFGSLRDSFAGLRTQFEQSASDFLTSSQQESLAKLAASGGLGGGGFRGGPGFGGFPGRGRNAPSDGND